MLHILAKPRINDDRLKVSIAAHIGAKCTLLLYPVFGEYYIRYLNSTMQHVKCLPVDTLKLIHPGKNQHFFLGQLLPVLVVNYLDCPMI